MKRILFTLVFTQVVLFSAQAQWFGGTTDAANIYRNGNVSIGTSSSSTFKLNVNGTSRFVDDVSIGNSKAVTQLQIFNTSLSSSPPRMFNINNYGNGATTSYWNGLLQANTGSLFYNGPLILHSTQGLIFSGSSAAEHMRISNNGNVGFGTSTPASLAHFVFNQNSTSFGTTAQYLVLSNSNTTPKNHSGIVFSNNAAGLGTSLISAKHNRDAGNSGRLTFYIRNLSGDLAEGLVIDEKSEIGIGTATPQAKVDIASNTSWQLKLENTNVGGGKWYFGASSDGWQVGGGKFLIGTNDASTSAKFALKSQGDLGLGITEPADKLHLYKPSGMIRHIIQTNDQSRAGIHIQHSTHSSTIGFMDNSNVLKINNTGSFGDNHFIITETGKIGIGTQTPGENQLAVNGTIKAKEVKVTLSDWPDYVFEESYSLPTLEEVEHHIKEKGHLKDIPSAKEVEENGVSLGKMDAKLLQKIEELTLYMIDLKKENDEMKKEIILLKENNLKKKSFSEKKSE